jgi:hypothetical protein
MPHTIRLRGPWEYQQLAHAVMQPDGSIVFSYDNLPAGGTMQVPADWGGVLGHDFRGLVRFTRHFAKPTGLDANSRVFLVVENVDWQAAVSVNIIVRMDVQLTGTQPAPCYLYDHPLSSAARTTPCPVRFEITEFLQPHNLLTIDVLLPRLAHGALPLHRPGRSDLPGGLIGLVKLEIEA